MTCPSCRNALIGSPHCESQTCTWQRCNACRAVVASDGKRFMGEKSSGAR